MSKEPKNPVLSQENFDKLAKNEKLKPLFTKWKIETLKEKTEQKKNT